MLIPLAAVPLSVYITLIVVASCLLLGSLLRWLFTKKPIVPLSIATQTNGDACAVIVKSANLVPFHDNQLTEKLAPSTPLSSVEQNALPQGLQQKLMQLFQDSKGKSFISEAPSSLQQYKTKNPSAARVNQFFNMLVINLDVHKARLKRMSESLEGQGLNWRRVRAVYGKTELIGRDEAQDKGLIHVHIDPASMCKWRDDGKSMYSPGAMGCAASHIKALQLAAASDKPTVILEDDLLLRGYAFREQLANLIDYIGNYKFDWLFLGAFMCISRSQPEEIIDVKDCFEEDAKNNCANFNMHGKSTCAYLVTPEGARKILAHFAKKGEPLRPSDHFVLAKDANGKEIDVSLVHPLWFTTVQAQSSDVTMHAELGGGTFQM